MNKVFLQLLKRDFKTSLNVSLRKEKNFLFAQSYKIYLYFLNDFFLTEVFFLVCGQKYKIYSIYSKTVL